MRAWDQRPGPTRLVWVCLLLGPACVPEEQPSQVLGFQPDPPASVSATEVEGEPEAPPVTDSPGEVPSEPSATDDASESPPSPEPDRPPPSDNPEPPSHTINPPKTAVGLSPRSIDAAGYVDAIERAADCADVALIQVTFAWDFLNGGDGAPYREAYDWLAAPDSDGSSILDRHGLGRAFWLSFTDPRHPEQIAAPNVDEIVSFADPNTQAAFVAECAWFAERFQPDFLALGVEIDSFLAAASADERDGFLSALRAACTACHLARPGCRVFVYFQYENVRTRGLWSTIAPFAQACDAYGFSSYPSSPITGPNTGLTSQTLSNAYYDEIVEQLGSDRAIVIAELGHPASPSGYFAAGSDAEQANTIGRVQAALSHLDVALVAWTYLYDPDLSTVYDPASAEYFGSMGLMRIDSPAPSGPGWDAWLGL